MEAKSPIRAALAAALVACTSVQAAPLYTIADLGTLGGPESRAFAINEKGEVAGESLTRERRTHAFRWTPDGGMTDLGTLGGATSHAYDLNDAGWVVGESETTSDVRRAFLWTPDGGMVEAYFPLQAVGSYAQAIDNQGRLVGAVDHGHGDAAVLWTNAADRPFVLAATGAVSIAFDIADDGAIVGIRDDASADPDATSRAFLVHDGHARALVELPEGRGSSARVALPGGRVAGQFDVGEGITHAFLYDPTNGLRDIDTMNNVFSAAFGANDRGDVVGTFFTSPSDDDQAFLYTDGTMYNLNDLLDTSDDWLLLEAWDINNAGQIAGYGLKDGDERAFLLTPASAGSSDALPAVKLTQPKRNASFTEPATIQLAADASSRAGLRRVAFYANAAVLGVATTEPYEITWTDVAAGDYDITARAFDKQGRMGLSERVRIRVGLPPNSPPVITFLRPDEALSVAAGEDVRINAQAEDRDGSIVGINVLVDGRVLASEPSDSISAVWTGGWAGTYGITVEAFDDRGGVSTSDLVRVTIEGGAAEAESDEPLVEDPAPPAAPPPAPPAPRPAQAAPEGARPPGADAP